MLKKCYFLLLILSVNLFAEESPSNFHPSSQNHLVKSILQHMPEVIHSYQDGKLYLDPTRVVLGEKGIFLEAQWSSIALPILYSDACGCFLKICDIGILVSCANCGYEFEITELVTFCPNCGYGEWPK